LISLFASVVLCHIPGIWQSFRKRNEIEMKVKKNETILVAIFDIL